MFPVVGLWKRLMDDNIGLDRQRETSYVMADNDIGELLKGRRADLLTQADEARSLVRDAEQRLAKIEGELRNIDTALRAIRNDAVHKAPYPEPTHDLTIKQGVLIVLQRVAPKGLSALSILERLRVELNMDYPRSSLSPQLSRLKGEGKLSLQGRMWYLKRSDGSGASASEPS